MAFLKLQLNIVHNINFYKHLFLNEFLGLKYKLAERLTDQ
jgi:hypothetical protein